MNNKKTIVIGIDGACWEYLNPLLEQGRLPNIKKLMDNGIHGVLKSTIPPLSPVAWSSFVTGKRPENHGIFDWWHWDENSKRFRPAMARDRKGIPFWKYLNKAGIKVGIINLPLTHPADEVDGFFISSFDTPKESRRKTFPRKLAIELESKYGEYAIHIPPFDMLDENRIEEFVKLYQLHDFNQTQMAIELMEKYGVSVLAINYMINDHFSHKMKDFKYVEKGLEITDSHIGMYLAQFPDANFIIISDHGSFRTKGTFLISEWLRNEGLLSFDEELDRRKRINTVLHHFLHHKLKLSGLAEKVLRNGLLLFVSLLPVNLQYGIIRLSNKSATPLFYWPWEFVDYKKSVVSLCSPAIGGFYVNKRLSFEENIIQKLIEKISQIVVSDTDSKLFHTICDRQKSYKSNFHLAPDIISFSDHNINTSAICNRAYLNGSYVVSDDDVNYYGAHTPNGIFIFSGTAFGKENITSDLNLLDIPRYILYLNNVPMPQDWDAQIMEELFNPKYLKINPIEIADSSEDNSDSSVEDIDEDGLKDIQDRLKSLGYL